jgi:hypothetical protein
MPQTQALVRTAKGIYTAYNSLHEVPEGAVLEAKNCAMYTAGAYSPRRGFTRFGTAFQPQYIFEFDGRLFGYLSGVLYYDSDGYGTWLAWEGTWAPPESGSPLRAATERTSVYLATSTGIYYTEAIATTPIRAGMPTGLDFQLAAYGGTAVWFYPNNCVGYRVLWGRLTDYGVLQVGAPSMRETITNVWLTGLSWTAAGTTVTVATSTTGMSNGDIITAQNLSDAAAEPSTGSITIVDPTHYSYTSTGTPAASGTGDFARVNANLLRITVPEDVQYGDFFEIYRTLVTDLGTSTDPGDEQKRVTRIIVNDAAVAKKAFTATGAATTVTVTLANHDFAAGDLIRISEASVAGLENGIHTVLSVTPPNTFTYTVVAAPATGSGNVRLLTETVIDALVETALSDPLYTNESEEGIEAANSRPPWAKDLALWKGRMWYVNTKKEQYIDLQCVSVANMVAGTSTVKLTVGVVTETYTAAAAEDASLRRFALDTTSATTAERIRNTMKSLVRVINRASESYYAWYTSGLDEPPGIFTIESRSLASDTFYVTANNATTGGEFEPEIPATGTDLASDNDRYLNGVYRSKLNQPHSVPDDYYDDTSLGDPSKEILRVLPTRDSLFVVKEDGVFRISGDSDRTFTYRALDLTVYGRAPRTWESFDNAIWGLSTKGLVRITESGTELVSATIGDLIDVIFSHSSYESLCFGIGYESEGLYLLACPEISTDTYPTMFYVFDSERSSGPTTWHWPSRCGLLKFSEQKLYLTRADTDDHIFVERKAYSDEDYMDEELECSLDAISTYTDDDLGTLSLVTVTFPVTATGNTAMVPKAGDLFRKTPGSLPYSKIRLAELVATNTYRLRLSHYFTGLEVGTASITRSIPVTLTWHPESGGAATVEKRFPRMALYFAEPLVTQASIGFRSDVEAETLVPIDYKGMPDRVIALPVPQNQSVGRTLRLKFQHQVALEPWELLERSIIVDHQSPEISMLPR